MAQPNTKRRDILVSATGGLIVLFVVQIVISINRQVPTGTWNYAVGIIGSIVGFAIIVALFNKYVFDGLERNPNGPVWKSFVWMGIAVVVIPAVSAGIGWLAQMLFAK